MINVQIAESLISYITFFIAYCISITLAGCFTAFVALHMGDETPAENGFLSFNPFAHIDILGTLFLILYNFGWGKFIPINPFNMHGRFKLFKVVFAFLAKTLAHIGLAIISLLVLLTLFGEKVLLQPLAQAYPDQSSYLLSIGLILISMLVVNMILALISFLINMCGMAVMFFVEKHPEYLGYSDIIMVLVPLILYYLVGHSLLVFIFGLIQRCGYFLGALLHVF